jgi:hypothetical protein
MNIALNKKLFIKKKVLPPFETTTPSIQEKGLK